MNHFKTYRSKIYRDFKAIAATDYRAVVRYFEENEKEICGLDFEEYFELLTAYTHALFEIGAYSKHLLMAPVVIEASIENNIHFYKGEDIYFKTLFEKAASFFNLHEYQKAAHILRELIKIDPYHDDTIAFLQKCERRQRPKMIRNARAFAMFAFLISALIISLEVLFIRPFYDDFLAGIEIARTALFGLGWMFLLLGEALTWWQINREVSTFVATVRQTKPGG